MNGAPMQIISISRGSQELGTEFAKELANKLKTLNLSDVLLVTVDPDENRYLAARNLYGVDVRDAAEIDPVSLIAYEKVLMTESAIKKIEEQLA